MRRVHFKEFLGTGMNNTNTYGYSNDFTGVGWFHEWGKQIEEDDSGFHEYTVAIVEQDGGEVVMVAPCHLKFVSPSVKATSNG